MEVALVVMLIIVGMCGAAITFLWFQERERLQATRGRLIGREDEVAQLGNEIGKIQADLDRTRQRLDESNVRGQEALAQLERATQVRLEVERRLKELSTSNSSLREQLAGQRNEIEEQRQHILQQDRQLGSLTDQLEQVRAASEVELTRVQTEQLSQLQRQMAVERDKLMVELRSADSELQQQQQLIAELRGHLGSRWQHVVTKKRIVVLGLPTSGKTWLTLQWANPVWEPVELEGTNFEKYTRVVSTVMEPEQRRALVYEMEIWDWGGEHPDGAIATLVKEEIDGMLIVVDVGRESRVDQARVTEQLQNFSPATMRQFLGDHVRKQCHEVVLFINKSDLIEGSPNDVEAEGRRLYSALIEAIEGFQRRSGFRFEVLVGSSKTGHNTHRLMPHFIKRLIPQSARGSELLQEHRRPMAESS